MATLYITEYSGSGFVASNNGPFNVQIQAPYTPPVASQTLSVSASPSVSAAFQNSQGNTGAITKVVRLHTDTICSVRFGAIPTAATTDARMVAGQTEYFAVQPGQKVSVILNV